MCFFFASSITFSPLHLSNPLCSRSLSLSLYVFLSRSLHRLTVQSRVLFSTFFLNHSAADINNFCQLPVLPISFLSVFMVKGLASDHFPKRSGHQRQPLDRGTIYAQTCLHIGHIRHRRNGEEKSASELTRVPFLCGPSRICWRGQTETAAETRSMSTETRNPPAAAAFSIFSRSWHSWCETAA